MQIECDQKNDRQWKADQPAKGTFYEFIPVSCRDNRSLQLRFRDSEACFICCRFLVAHALRGMTGVGRLQLHRTAGENRITGSPRRPALSPRSACQASRSAAACAISASPGTAPIPSARLTTRCSMRDPLRDRSVRFQVNASNLADKRHITTCLARGDCFYGIGRTVLGSATYRFLGLAAKRGGRTHSGFALYVCRNSRVALSTTRAMRSADGAGSA